MKKFAVSLIFFISTYFIHGFEPNAYVYILPSYQVTPDFVKNFNLPNAPKVDDYSINGLVRFRTRPEFKISNNINLNIHYEVNANASTLNFSGLDINNLSGENQRQALDLSWLIYSDDHTQVNHYFDRFYLQGFFDWGELSLGRQRISWGTGRIWQPTDLFNPINPANFSKFEKDGADVFMTKIYLGNFSDIDLVYNFTDDLTKSNVSGRIRTNYKGFDLSLMSGYFDRNYVLGGDLAKGFMGVGLRGEWVFFADDTNFNDNFLRFILGADYQFTDELYCLIEYQFNGEGFDDTSKYELLRLASGEILVMNRNYVFVQSLYQLTELLSVGGSLIQNINDGSGYSGINLIYSLSDNSVVNLSSLFFYGDEFTEFSYFSTSVFANIQYYF